jgi:hypothetical protein
MELWCVPFERADSGMKALSFWVASDGVKSTDRLESCIAVPPVLHSAEGMSTASSTAELPAVPRESERIRGFDEIVDSTTTMLVSGLAASFWNRSTWQGRPWDAEHRKLFARLLSSLGDLRRLEHDNRCLDDGTKARLALLLSAPRALGSTDSTIELVDEVRKALVPIGDERYLRPLLVDERSRDLRRKSRQKSGSSPGSTLIGWSDVYPDVSLSALLTGPFDIEKVRTLLLSFYECRRERYRLHRARVRMKADYLLLLAPILFGLIAGLAIAIAVLHSGGGGTARTVLAALAGALGGSVSGAYRLRDQIEDLNQVRAFKPALWVQPLIGAAAGLILLLVLESGLLGQDASTWERTGLLAFAAGFSEPFFLGVVNRVTSAGADPRSTQTT